MRKRILSFLLCILLLLSLALPVSAKEKETEKPEIRHYTISNLAVFLNLAEKCRLDSFSENLSVSLKTDIDLTGTEFAGIPIFSGTFEGNGHTIRGLSVTGEGSNQGLFRYLTDTAVVRDLHVEGTVQPGGTRSQIGGIAGSNAGQILNCSFTGTVSGNAYIGGFVGINEISGILENCEMNGKVSGSHFVGGLAGKNSGVIRSSENNALINDTAQQNTVDISDITLDGLISAESVNAVTDIGGIAGTSTGVIRSCVNRGNVGYQHMGYNIGGIAGTQSGAILDCENHGEIQGRKEVGGIVGQMEPTALMEYEEDALQILQRQLSGMADTVSKTVSNVQSTSDAIVGKVGTLQNYVWDARDAVDSLIPDRENPTLPDMDTIQAAQNSLSSSISGMSQTLQGMSATTQSAMGTLSTNLYALQSQINAMRTTLGNVSETLGGSITDVSDRDTELDLTGKAAGCVNYGTVLADRNAGGIAGAMALENDLDHEEDWKIDGENSLNFESELRAVILNCENTAKVTCRKQNAGGIVGLQSLGLVKNSRNTGTLDAEGADYVGGVAGQSLGFLRADSAKCEIFGSTFVGGIAGSAAIATDCRSMVKFSSAGEKLGAVLGDLEENRMEEPDPISGNLYLSVFEEAGGIDGISYGGMAEPVTREEFLALEDLPDLFRTVTIRFRYGNGNDRTFAVPLAGDFSQEWIPPIPPKNGYVASWEGLTEEAISEVLFDVTFEPHYVGRNVVLQSDAVRGNAPILLLQGSFTEGAALTVEVLEEIPAENGETLLEAWNFAASGVESITGVRYHLPEQCDAERVKVMLQGPDGAWREAEHTADGSYLVVPLEAGDSAIALIQTPAVPWIPMAAAAAVLLVLLLLVYRKRKQSKT